MQDHLLDSVTVDTWLLRGIMHTTKVGGRILRGRRLFSVLAIFEAAVIGELVAFSDTTLRGRKGGEVCNG